MKKILIIVLAVVLVLVIAGIAVFFLFLRTPAEEPIVYSEYTFDEEYSNLADEDSGKIIKYQVTIEYTNEDILPLIEQNATKIRNNIDEIMRSTLSADIEATNGKQKLRQRIQDMIIETLDSDEETITNIYIQPFVVQG
ncbi:MAG: Flagellar basal body-associated protein FliL [Clostridiales bacterium]|jgi:flagellar basal body-associated protein FliL|nr:Flagellar basal body-associated protein FliL [Clostridiales bacterium]